MNTKRTKSVRNNRSKPAIARQTSGKSGGFEVALGDIFSVLSRRTGLLFASILTSFGLGFAYYSSATPKFESTAEILVERRDAAISADGTSLSGGGSDVSREMLATHMRIIQSKRNIDKAIASFYTTENDGDGKDLSTQRVGELPSLLAKVSEDLSLSDYISDNLFVTSGGNVASSNAHVLNLRFRHVDAVDSRRVLNALVDQYQLFLKDQYEQDNSQITDLIDEARLELETELTQLEGKYRDFRATAPVLVSGEQTSNAIVQHYEDLLAEIATVDSSLADGQSRLQLVLDGLQRYEASDAPDLQRLTLIDGLNVERMSVLLSVDRGEVATASFQAEQPERMASATSEFSSLLEKKSQLASLQQTFGDSHPDVVSLQQQVRLAEEFVRSKAANRSMLEDKPMLTPAVVMDAYVSLLRNDIEALKYRKEMLLLASNEAEANVRSLVDYELQAETLLHERLRKQSLYDSTVDNLRSLALSSKSGPNLIHEVLEKAEIGERVEPNLLTAAAIAIFGTLLLGASLVGVAELSDNSVHKAEELETIFAAPVIHSVPEFSRDSEVRTAMRAAQRAKSPVSKVVVSYHAPESRMAEIFRSLRTHLMFAIGGGAKVLCVTSAKAGEGKSTIASNLAVTLAQTGRQVLLIDCDMRRPRVAQILGVQSDSGLQQVLSGNCELMDAVVSCDIPNLNVMTAGGFAKNAAELLDNASFDQLLCVVREKFDLVILDCPPVLPVADTTVIAQKADRTLVVVRVDSQTRPHSERVISLLSSVSVQLVGIVVNRSPNIREKYDYYSDQSYGQNSDSPKKLSPLADVAAV